jgi:hypothetical protein
MVVAELEVHLSRPIAPTRRVALGERTLPVDPAPGFGGVLLGGIVARFAPELDPESLPEIVNLVGELEAGRRVPQPRLRHRFQQDKVGLLRSRHRLIDDGDELRFDFDEKGTASQHVLCAVYAAGALPYRARRRVMDCVRTGLVWRGGIDARLVAALSGSIHLAAVGDPVGWAMDVLDLRSQPADDLPTRRAVQQAFRDGLRLAHPDNGGGIHDAAQQIARLSEARRILLGS